MSEKENFNLVFELYGYQCKFEHIVLYGHYIDIERQNEIKTDLIRVCDLAKQIVENSGAYNLFIRRVADELRDYVQRVHFSKSNCEKQTVNGETLYVIPHDFLMNVVIRVVLIGDYIEHFNDDRYDRNNIISIDEE